MASSTASDVEPEQRSRVVAWLADMELVRGLAGKCGVQTWVVAAAVAAWIGWVLWGVTGELICTAVGCLYPMFASFRVLEDGDRAQVSRWLSYWVVFATVLVINGLLHNFLCWIPFYSFLRFALVVWLLSPATFGADIVYRWLVCPALRRYRSKIDGALHRSAQELRGTLKGAVANDQLRHAFGEESIQEMVTNELAKGAAAGLCKVAATGAATLLEQGPMTVIGGARRRVASPAPVLHKVHKTSPAESVPEPVLFQESEE